MDSHALEPEWHDPPPNPDMSLGDSLQNELDHYSLQPIPEEEQTVSEGVSEREPTVSEGDTSFHQQPWHGWNDDHRYNTRFKSRVTANLGMSHPLLCDAVLYDHASAFIAEQTAIHVNTDGTPSELNPFSLLKTMMCFT